MIYLATIEWTDTKQTETVLVSDSVMDDSHRDRELFFYFEGESEIKEYMNGKHFEFRILDYKLEHNQKTTNN